MTDTTQAPPAKGWGELLAPYLTAATPWLTGRLATALVAVAVAGFAQYKVQAWDKEIAVSTAELGATLRMAGTLDSKSERRVDDVAAGAAQRCVEAFSTYAKANSKKK